MYLVEELDGAAFLRAISDERRTERWLSVREDGVYLWETKLDLNDPADLAVYQEMMSRKGRAAK